MREPSLGGVSLSFLEASPRSDSLQPWLPMMRRRRGELVQVEVEAFDAECSALFESESVLRTRFGRIIFAFSRGDFNEIQAGIPTPGAGNRRPRGSPAAANETTLLDLRYFLNSLCGITRSAPQKIEELGRIAWS